MTEIKTFADAEAALARYVPLVSQFTGKNLTVERMRPLMEALGNPQKKLKIIHIAGTSGKTSTSYFIAALLTAAGKSTGLTVSPHVDKVNERIQINLLPLSEAGFAAALSDFLGLISAAEIKPTYFELMVAFAYWYFATSGVDYAVIETGMGGLHDSTNIADNSDKLCVITDIGLDHMHILGDTLPAIARQKAGIIHESNQVVMYRQSDEVIDVFQQRCKEKKALLNIVDEPSLKTEHAGSIDSIPLFQRRNWLLAHEAFRLLQQRDEIGQLNSDQLSETMHVSIPGRMEAKTIGSKTIIMDGAHNEQKMQAFIKSFERQFPKTSVPVLLSLKQSKEFTTLLPVLKSVTSKLIITEFSSSQDLPAHAIDAEELGKAARKLGFKNVAVEPDNSKAYNLLLAEPNPVVIITGSFYLLGQLRHNHKELMRAQN